MKVVEELKMKLENASLEEIKALQQNEDPIYWFLLLAEYPEFAPDSSWRFDLRNRCDLLWSQLLAKQPQFAIHCDLKQLYPNQRRLIKLFGEKGIKS